MYVLKLFLIVPKKRMQAKAGQFSYKKRKLRYKETPIQNNKIQLKGSPSSAESTVQVALPIMHQSHPGVVCRKHNNYHVIPITPVFLSNFVHCYTGVTAMNQGNPE